MTVRRLLPLVVLLVVSLAGCEVHSGPVSLVQGSGSVKSQKRSVSGIDRVSLSGVGTLTITQGSAESLNVQAEDNILPLLRSEVSGGTLLLGPTSPIVPTRSINYDLTVKTLQSIEVSGAANVTATRMEADQLMLTVTGTSNVSLGPVTANSLTINISGGASVTASGHVPTQTVDISGAAKYQATGLDSQQAVVTVTGAGDCEVKVSTHLSVTITGAGHVGYTGSPTVRQQITGAGSISRD